MSLFIDAFLIISGLLFIAGIVGVFMKVFKVKSRLRYLFVASILCFSISLAFGWQDFVDGFIEGYNNCRNTDTTLVYVLPE